MIWVFFLLCIIWCIPVVLINNEINKHDTREAKSVFVEFNMAYFAGTGLYIWNPLNYNVEGVLENIFLFISTLIVTYLIFYMTIQTRDMLIDESLKKGCNKNE